MDGDYSIITDKKFFQTLKSLDFIEKIYLFGSRAIGNHTERSDIDLAIDCPEANSTQWQTVADVIDQADTLLKIDYVRYDKINDAEFLKAINTHKVCLYQKGKDMQDRANQSLTLLGKALHKLNAIMDTPLDEQDYVLDAAIQRFEFVIELFWKTLKHLLREHGIETALPKQAVQEAYAAGWLDDETVWLNMMNDRNVTSHTYRESYALEIYEHIKTYMPEFNSVYEKLLKLKQ